MGCALHENDEGGLLLQVEAWELSLCQHGGCEACPNTRDLSPVITFFWNAGIAIALAAQFQAGLEAARTSVDEAGA